MLRLAVTTDAETLDRIRAPLAERGIAVEHLRAKERAIRVSGGVTGTGGADGAVAHGADGTDDRFDVGFVYPSRLMEGGAIDARLSIPWVNGRDAVVTSRNKAGVIAALDRADLPVPRTTMVSNPVDDDVVADAVADFSFPVVVKPNSATRGIGVAKAADLDSLFGIVDYLNLAHDYRATGDKSYLIQEFLPDARDYRAMVVDGTYAGAVRRELPAGALTAGRWKHNVHRGADARGVDLDDDARELAERTAATLGIDYLGVDLLATDGRLLVNETNARPTVDAATKYEPGFYDRLAGLIERVSTQE
ncbi:ATP-grasp domain-containing protein [Halorubrum sp. JWXQ-INN 858]|uniref:ATP-grasp domain-containing protein n=1 Tax=Halorubrum sp. JWXQ-INN 858 TaxID=2690782 RepID=UPI00135C90B7|nr:RimK family alpha-L-glutamate ligase [Halorubrum sp. JWXQ-INN 858]MWV63972.1 ATP-grasp domain-containing protein [Halorubrum sp. JWXQ-INN 858]